MKEDILEQLVDDFLQSRGYFTRHNIKFRPDPNHPDFDSKLDSNHSDIDVLGIHPLLRGPDKIWAVSCKSWQGGLNVSSKIKEIEENKISSGREAWKGFREIVSPKWSEAFIAKILELTGSSVFTYVTAVTKARGDKSSWETHPKFNDLLGKSRIKIITFEEMVDEMFSQTGTTVASSDLGRLIQLLKASGWHAQRERI